MKQLLPNGRNDLVLKTLCYACGDKQTKDKPLEVFCCYLILTNWCVLLYMKIITLYLFSSQTVVSCSRTSDPKYLIVFSIKRMHDDISLSTGRETINVVKTVLLRLLIRKEKINDFVCSYVNSKWTKITWSAASMTNCLFYNVYRILSVPFF